MAATMIAVSAVIAYRQGHPAGERHSWATIRKSFWSALPALMMPVVILGGIFGGIVTPTEAGAVAVGYGLLAGLVIYRSLRLRDLPKILFQATKQTSSIMIIIAGAACFGFLIAREIDGNAIVGLFSSLTQQRWILLLMLIGIILVLGMFMEGGSIMIILTPLLMPVLLVYEIDAIHFGVIFQVAIMIGLLTPPVGMLLFVLSGASGSPVTQIVRNMWPFYLAMLVVVLLIAFVPGMSLWLVEALGKGVK
jgi:C4-dicarboxylate transporter DctM subunit